jgi:hypothetical protein
MGMMPEGIRRRLNLFTPVKNRLRQALAPDRRII